MRLRMVGVLIVAMLLGGLQGSALAAPDPVETACSPTGVHEPDLTSLHGTPAPDLASVYRETSGSRSTWEDATLSGGVHWTRKGGDDVVVKLGNARTGYTLKIYDGGMQLLRAEAVSLCDPFVSVPLGTGEGYYNRVFVYSTQSAEGPSSRAAFGVDTTPPVVASQVRTSDTTVDVTFSEALHSGRNYASDWYASASFDYGTSWTAATSVDDVNAQTRRVHFDPTALAGGAFNGVDYLLSGDESDRYRDPAGNVVANTLG